MADSRKTESDWVDPDDAPELDEEWFEGAYQYHDDKLVKRGRGRPPIEPEPGSDVPDQR